VRRATHGQGAGVRLRTTVPVARAVALPRAVAFAVALAGALALALAACGSARHDPKPAPPVAVASPVVKHLRPARPSPAAIALGVALRRWLALEGPGGAGAVYDLQGQAPLFALRAGNKQPPASVEKLYTSLALARKLGPGARLHTTVLGTGHLGPGGVWHGNLYLRGGGDPTLGDGTFNRVFELGYGPTTLQLTQQLTQDGIHSVTGSVIGDASLFDSSRGGPATGDGPDIPDFGGQLGGLTYDHGATGRFSPGAFAAKQFVLTLAGAHVKAVAARSTARTPSGARRLAIVSSPPVSVMLRLMDVPSDDFFAEMLTKQLGARFAHAGTISAGARVIKQVIKGFGLHPTIVDGSGLSRSDRSSPLEVVDLLRDLWRTPDGDLLEASLPVVGVNGTVRNIATRTAAQGNCEAKTGTLNGVTNLAGYCRTRSHHVLAFALFAQGPTNARALVLEGQMLAAIARF